MESAVTLFPEPDSPTRQRVSPLFIEKETPSTALTSPASVKKEVLRLLIFSSSTASLNMRFKGVSRAKRKGPQPLLIKKLAVGAGSPRP